jgi:uncharacterized membrane protein YraQ (UPF0718 family)
MRDILASAVAILGESAPYLLLGFALAGVLHVLLARFPGITARLTRPGRRSVLYGALIGVPMPLCSCSVLPAAMALRRDGASKGATASFLVSVPETDVVSILVTLALIGPAMAIFRPLAAIAAALVTGLAVSWLLEGRSASESELASAGTQGCHCGGASAAEVSSQAGTGAPATAGALAPVARALRYGFVEIFDDIVLQLLLGIAIAALLGAWLPALDAGTIGGSVVWQYLAMLALGIPLYVCATASTPVAAGFIAGGISPGAAMVFLLAGPATNVASLVVLRAQFGARFLGIYLAGIAVTSVAAGALFDALIGRLALPPVEPALHAHDGLSPLRVAAISLFLVLTAASLWRTRSLPRAASGLKRIAARMVAR